jgi:hypothetical protein
LREQPAAHTDSIRILGTGAFHRPPNPELRRQAILDPAARRQLTSAFGCRFLWGALLVSSRSWVGKVAHLSGIRRSAAVAWTIWNKTNL